MKVVCEHCALPFSIARTTPGRAIYCCSGCALAARMTTDARGQFAVNGPLVTALSVGFVFFNQALLWLLAILLARDLADPSAQANAARLAWGSLAVGALVWGALGFFQVQVGARRAADLAVLFGAALLIGCGLNNAQPAIALAANALLAAWALRGLGRKRRRA